MRPIALLLAVLLTTSAAIGDDRAMDLLREWIAMVDRHAVGEHDAAITALSEWTLDDLNLMQEYVEAFAEVPLNSSARSRRRAALAGGDLGSIRQLTTDLKRRGDFDRFQKRAALLHTDAAMFGSFRLTVPQPPPRGLRGHYQNSRRVDVLSHDGAVRAFQTANPHWEYARNLLDALPKSPRPDPLLAQWYRAIGAHFMLDRSFAEAIDHFNAARSSVPDDPAVLYGEACLQEVFGAPRIQDYVRVVTRNGVAIRDVSSPQSHFRRAVEMLRKALAARPDFVEARLRLGRLLVELKHYDEAVTHLHQVVGAATEPRLRYYAHIFSGDALVALSRTAEARAAYERALELYPKSQAARLGQATTLRMMGSRQASVDAVMSTLTLPSESRDEFHEPWWNYYYGDEATVDRLLDALRAPYREPRQ